MNKDFLINSVSRLLGVSSSEKEFAFQIFLEKTGEVIGVNEALKYPDLGFFYFKKSSREGDEFVESLQFVPIRDGSETLEENFFLSFDVKRRNKGAMEFDPSVFSLSIDKTILPFEMDKGHNADISYHLLKKTIEERVEELIASASRIENFKILDTLFTENSVKDEYVPTDEKEIFEIQNDTSYEEMIFSKMNLDEGNEPINADDFDIIDKSPNIVEATEENDGSFSYESEESTKAIETSADKNIQENSISDFDFLDLGNKKDDVDWAWEEKNSENVESGIIPFNDEITVKPVVSISDLPERKVEMKIEEDDPFGELEKTIEEEEIVENEIAKEVEVKESVISEVSIIPKETTTEKEEQNMAENNDNTPVEDNNPYADEDSNQKRNILLVGGLVIIVLVAVYIVFFNGFGLMKKSTPPVQPPKTDQVQNQSGDKADSIKMANADSQQPTAANKPGLPLKTDIKSKTEDKTQKLKESAAGDLLRESKNESKVGSNIFTDGTKFFVQLSSWKNIEKAQQEAKKLKAKGLDAFIVKAYIEQFKGTWYRVRVGTFKTKEEAQAFSDKNR